MRDVMRISVRSRNTGLPTPIPRLSIKELSVRGGRSIFQGLIEVAPGAAKTDAYLTNNNLVLGNGARADSLPKLNILTDDVRCSHGSTTGKLDTDQLFYLVSRGFSPQEATKELTRGFLWEAVGWCSTVNIRDSCRGSGRRTCCRIGLTPWDAGYGPHK